ncbi:MAG: AzlD domain-containing protein [Deferribacteraceae bacterium]|nr:AzlD domain-containing protein [Deferribacteraceae bacterium]
MLSVQQIITATVIAAAVTLFTRAAPFVFFGKNRPSPAIMYMQRYIPPMTMVILVIYCLKDIAWQTYPYGFPALFGAAVTAALHMWRRNALISIFAGTTLYMFMIRVL